MVEAYKDVAFNLATRRYPNQLWKPAVPLGEITGLQQSGQHDMIHFFKGIVGDLMRMGVEDQLEVKAWLSNKAVTALNNNREN